MNILRSNCKLCFYLLVSCIFVGYLLVGCSPLRVNNTRHEKEETMNNYDVTLETTKPPIDLQGSIKTETATFALG